MKGLIISNISNLYQVKAGNQIIECNARGRIKQEELSPVVGDNVEIEFLENENKALGSMGLFAIGSFMSVFSFGIASVGGMCLLVAHRRELTAYSAQQVMPIAKEGIEEMTPTMKKATEEMAPAAGKVAEEVAKGIKKGLDEDK